MNPGDTAPRRGWAAGALAPLNEGRGVNPGDTPGPRQAGSGRSPLNEGRGVNPGDTPFNILWR